jgi:hypothetical protein
VNDLDSRLRASNPVQAEDVAGAADSPSAFSLLQHVLAQSRAGAAPRRFARRRLWALTGVTAALAATALVAVVLQVPSGTPAAPPHHPAPDTRLVDFTVRHGNIIARITDPDAAASQLTAVFRGYGLNVTVEAIPVSPSLVGTLVFTQVSAIRTLWKPGCADVCPVGLVFPADFHGSGHIVVGRAALPGERYESMNEVFAPGEALHCAGLLGQPPSVALPVLRKLGLHARWYALGPGGTTHWEQKPVGYIIDGDAISASEVELRVGPAVPDTSYYRSLVSQSRGCR